MTQFITYQNLSGKSGVSEYRYDDQFLRWIEIQFTDDSTYLYTDASCGWQTVLYMIDLGNKGVGLNRFINAEDPDYIDKTR